MILSRLLHRIVDHAIGRLVIRLMAGLSIALLAGTLSVEASAEETPSGHGLEFFEELLRNPDDVRANLAYAQALAAEGRVEEARQIYRKVLTLNPGNPTALAALSAPASPSAQTDYMFRTGGAIETNSARRDPDFKPYLDTLGFAEFAVNDLRRIGAISLQSNLDLYSDIHNRYSPGNVSYFSLDTGPVFDLYGMGKVRTAVGGEYVLQGQSPVETYRTRQFEFDSINAIVNYLPPGQQALQSINLLVGYNNFRESASFRSGPVIRLTAPTLLTGPLLLSSQVLVTPGYVLNGARQLNGALLQPAHYNEINLDALSLTPLAEHQLGASRIFAVAGVFLAGDLYNSETPGESPNRRDFRVIPRVGVRFADFLFSNLQLDLDYRYDRNFSNEFVETYRDNIFSLTLTSRF